ncbi:AEC family transporter [uncultured Maritalea sp.]|uniref:AEC family transporter n=1 Tax=uncultured Maritalea sp. TaxID=757249 RepID=UPI00261DA9E4|nr:AEC family transporter [uncultured Maritalea sp.]
MLAAFENILPVFAIVMLGFGLRKSNFVTADKWQIVDELCFWVLFPALLVSTLVKADFSQIELGAVTAVMLLMVVITTALVLAIYPVLRRVWKIGKPQYTTVFQTVSRYHGFIALAIVLELFGPEGSTAIALSFAVMVPLIQFVNIVVLVSFSETIKFSFANVALGVVKNPIFLGAMLGLVLNFGHVPIWKPVLTFMDLLASAALGLSLLALGAGLSLKAALNPSREMWVGVLGRLLMIPTLMGVLCWIFGVSGMTAQVLLIFAAVPAAANGYVLAKKMGGDAELYASTLTVQTVFSFMTVPIVIWVGANFFA